jgi:hypothetical protein
MDASTTITSLDLASSGHVPFEALGGLRLGGDGDRTETGFPGFPPTPSHRQLPPSASVPSFTYFSSRKDPSLTNMAALNNQNNMAALSNRTEPEAQLRDIMENLQR